MSGFTDTYTWTWPQTEKGKQQHTHKKVETNETLENKEGTMTLLLVTEET